MAHLLTSLPLLFAQDEALEVGAGLAGGALLIWSIVAIATVVMWIWAIVDAIRNPALSDLMRIVWIAVIFFFPVVGAIVYLLVGRSTTGTGATPTV